MISQFTKATKPLGTTADDQAYLARQRRIAWLGMFCAAGKLAEAPNEGLRKCAAEEIVKYRDRLSKLGIKSEDAPEPQSSPFAGPR